MKKKAFRYTLIEAQKRLEADDHGMARHLRISLATYRTLVSGARVLPLPAQQSLKRRLNGLYDKCGLERVE